MRTLKISKANLHAQIVGLVRSGRAESRASLAKFLKVAPSTMSLYVDQLIAAGWIKEAGLVQGKTGRPKVRLALESKNGWFAGLEFTASRAQVVAVDFAGRLLQSQACPIPAGGDADAVIQTLQNAVREMTAGVRAPLLGIGVGEPGLVDTEAGICRYSIIFPNWRDVPLRFSTARPAQAATAPTLSEDSLRLRRKTEQEKRTVVVRPGTSAGHGPGAAAGQRSSRRSTGSGVIGTCGSIRRCICSRSRSLCP